MPMSEIPERRENWAEAEFAGGAKTVLTLRSGHVLVSDEPAGFPGGTGGENVGPTPTGFLVAAFAADIPVMLNRIARELEVEVKSLRARVQIAWNPRAIAGIAPGIEPIPFEATTDIWIVLSDSSALKKMRSEYEKRCPLYNLFKKAGCSMIERWHPER